MSKIPLVLGHVDCGHVDCRHDTESLPYSFMGEMSAQGPCITPSLSWVISNRTDLGSGTAASSLCTSLDLKPTKRCKLTSPVLQHSRRHQRQGTGRGTTDV